MCGACGIHLSLHAAPRSSLYSAPQGPRPFTTPPQSPLFSNAPQYSPQGRQQSAAAAAAVTTPGAGGAPSRPPSSTAAGHRPHLQQQQQQRHSHTHTHLSQRDLHMMQTAAADDASERHAAVAGAELHAEAAGGVGSGGRRSPRSGGGPRRPVSVGMEVWTRGEAISWGGGPRSRLSVGFEVGWLLPGSGSPQKLIGVKGVRISGCSAS